MPKDLIQSTPSRPSWTPSRLKSPMKPIAAETLNGMPVTVRPKMPPATAMGITLMASSVSVSELKFIQRSAPINSSVIGTTSLSLLMAS